MDEKPIAVVATYNIGSALGLVAPPAPAAAPFPGLPPPLPAPPWMPLRLTRPYLNVGIGIGYPIGVTVGGYMQII